MAMVRISIEQHERNRFHAEVELGQRVPMNATSLGAMLDQIRAWGELHGIIEQAPPAPAIVTMPLVETAVESIRPPISRRQAQRMRNEADGKAE